MSFVHVLGVGMGIVHVGISIPIRSPVSKRLKCAQIQNVRSTISSHLGHRTRFLENPGITRSPNTSKWRVIRELVRTPSISITPFMQDKQQCTQSNNRREAHQSSYHNFLGSITFVTYMRRPDIGRNAGSSGRTRWREGGREWEKRLVGERNSGSISRLRWRLEPCRRRRGRRRRNWEKWLVQNPFRNLDSRSDSFLARGRAIESTRSLCL